MLLSDTLAAITVTYFTCVRPMLRGQRHCGPATDQDPELSPQIAELRAEVVLGYILPTDVRFGCAHGLERSPNSILDCYAALGGVF